MRLPEQEYIQREENGRTVTICTMRQIVLHTIGLDYKKPYTRHGRKFYKPYRNFFSTKATDKTWLALKANGYADHGRITRDGNTDFYLTRKGLDWLGEELGITIKNEEE
jgi:hypothetical protein